MLLALVSTMVLFQYPLALGGLLCGLFCLHVSPLLPTSSLREPITKKWHLFRLLLTLYWIPFTLGVGTFAVLGTIIEVEKRDVGRIMERLNLLLMRAI